MRNRLRHIMLLFLVLMNWGCEDWNLQRLDFVSLVIEDIEEEGNLVRVTSRITGLERETVDEYGHLWSRSSDALPTIEQNEGRAAFNSLRPEEAQAPFSSRIDKRSLVPKTPYTFRAYALIGGRCFYSDNTLSYQSSPVILQTGPVQYESGDTATVEGRIIVQDQAVQVLDYGHCWSTDGAPETGDGPCSAFGPLIASDRQFVTTIEALEDGRTYTVVPYAVIQIDDNDTGVCYGEPVRFEARLGQFWSALEMPEALRAREGAHTFTYGDSVAFLAGGLFQDGRDTLILDDCWRYSTATGWRPCREKLPVPLAFGATFTIENSGYLGSGWTTGQGMQEVAMTNRFFTFDMEEERWQEVQPLPLPLVFATGFSDQGSGYIGTGLALTESLSTGNDSLLTTADFWRYDAGSEGGWEPAEALESARLGMVSVKVAGQVYLGSGLDQFGVAGSKFWRFDDNRFEPVELGGDLNARAFGVAFSDNTGKGYLALGIGRNFELPRDILMLSSEVEGWQPVLEFPAQGRLFASGFSLQGKLFFGLGAPPDGEPLGDFWVYTP